MGLTLGWWTMINYCELDYSYVGFYFIDSGGQGGTLIAFGEVWERSLKHGLGLKNDSFGLSMVCLGGLKL